MSRRHESGAPRSRAEGLFQSFGHADRADRLQVVADGSAMALSVFVAAALRYDFAVPDRKVSEVLLVRRLRRRLVRGLRRRCGASTPAVGASARSRRCPPSSRRIVLGHAVLWASPLLLPKVDSERPIPLSVPLIASTIMLATSAGVRYVWRLFYDRRLRPRSEGVERVVVIGAGEGGQQIITAMLRNPLGRYLPGGALDDDPAKRNLRVRGVPGQRHPRTTWRKVAARHDAARGPARHPQRRLRPDPHLRRPGPASTACACWCCRRPASSTAPRSASSDIRPVTHADLLGRHEVDTDVESIAGYLTGKRVLVTGAGGSIGSELCRQLYRFAPASLVMLDRDESALHAVQLSIEGRALLDSRNLVVADIRDADRVTPGLRRAPPRGGLPRRRAQAPAAARDAPERGAQDQRLGHPGRSSTPRWPPASSGSSTSPPTRPPTRAACSATPSASPSGSPPRPPTTADGIYLSVRFGNVLGSRGSVLTAFAAQIEAGGPVTVTDPDVTRYFMTVEEAVQLVIQAGAVGRDGEALVLDMGEPVRIDDVARRLIAEADRPIEIVYTGPAPRREAPRGAVRRRRGRPSPGPPAHLPRGRCRRCRSTSCPSPTGAGHRRRRPLADCSRDAGRPRRAALRRQLIRQLSRPGLGPAPASVRRRRRARSLMSCCFGSTAWRTASHSSRRGYMAGSSSGRMRLSLAR